MILNDYTLDSGNFEYNGRSTIKATHEMIELAKTLAAFKRTLVRLDIIKIEEDAYKPTLMYLKAIYKNTSPKTQRVRFVLNLDKADDYKLAMDLYKNFVNIFKVDWSRDSVTAHHYFGGGGTFQTNRATI